MESSLPIDNPLHLVNLLGRCRQILISFVCHKDVIYERKKVSTSVIPRPLLHKIDV